MRRIFYRLIDALSEDALPHDAGDFRLIDRRVIEELRHVRDQQPYLRGLIAAMGFRQIGVPYNRAARERGSSKFGFWRLVGLALDGILHHSTVPLRLATAVGFVMCGLAFLGALYFLIARSFGAEWPEGWASHQRARPLLDRPQRSSPWNHRRIHRPNLQERETHAARDHR